MLVVLPPSAPPSPRPPDPWPASASTARLPLGSRIAATLRFRRFERLQAGAISIRRTARRCLFILLIVFSFRAGFGSFAVSDSSKVSRNRLKLKELEMQSAARPQRRSLQSAVKDRLDGHLVDHAAPSEFRDGRSYQSENGFFCREVSQFFHAIPLIIPAIGDWLAAPFESRAA